VPAQQDVDEHLDLGSARYVRELRHAGEIPDPRTATMGQIRAAYMRGLRDEAAGRGAGPIRECCLGAGVDCICLKYLDCRNIYIIRISS
jgi:hypothetical protein